MYELRPPISKGILASICSLCDKQTDSAKNNTCVSRIHHLMDYTDAVVVSANLHTGSTKEVAVEKQSWPSCQA